MRKNKNLLMSLISLLLILSLSACQFTPPDDDNGNYGGGNENEGGENNGGNENEGTENGGEGEETDPFTVRLICDGDYFEPYKKDEEVIYAQWSDGYNLFTSPIDESGFATISGLDGDYQVTLSHLPSGYSYNPNIYFSTNDAKNIIIDVYKQVSYRGTGSNLYTNCIKLTKNGVYRAELKNDSQIVYFEYSPTKSGTYTVESWMDVTENQFNPKIDIYTGTFAAKYFKETVDVGGVEMGYTKNFLFKVEITDDMIGNCYTFGVKVTSKNDLYPAYVDFAIQRNGSFDRPETDRVMIIPEQLGLKLRDGRTKEDFASESEFILAYKAENTYVGKNFVYAAKSVNGSLRLDGSVWGLNEESGYYQRYNEESGKFDGPILYAKITEPCRYLDTAIHVIEDIGNSYLTVSNGRENYKLFIEGYESLKECSYMGPDGIFNYSQYEGIEGYADYANKDGVVPVTEELKDFLQKLSISQLYFRDGNGWCETHDVYPTDSIEEDQWLFACGYYN